MVPLLRERHDGRPLAALGSGAFASLNRNTQPLRAPNEVSALPFGTLSKINFLLAARAHRGSRSGRYGLKVILDDSLAGEPDI